MLQGKALTVELLPVRSIDNKVCNGVCTVVLEIGLTDTLLITLFRPHYQGLAQINY
jgi:hypothetical protein